MIEECLMSVAACETAECCVGFLNPEKGCKAPCQAF